MIKMCDISYQYNSQILLDNINLNISQGDFVTFFGANGCGKTTLFNLVTAIDRPTSGEILLNGISSPHYQKPIAYLNQKSLLLPFLTLKDNILLPLKYSQKKPEQTRRFYELVGLFGLQDFLNQYPYQVSGGIQQKTALARNLMIEADIFLFDESFHAIDYLSRFKVYQDISTILKTDGKTVLFITHDIQEALLLSDKIVILGTDEQKKNQKKGDIKTARNFLPSSKTLSLEGTALEGSTLGCSTLECLGLNKTTNILKILDLKQNWDVSRKETLRSGVLDPYKKEMESIF